MKKEKFPGGDHCLQANIRLPLLQFNILNNRHMKKNHAAEEDERPRYSDAELNEFRELILEKLEKARRDFVHLTEAYTSDDENETNDSPASFKVLEDGSQALTKDENAKLAMRQEKFIQSLENALLRIENKTYGICRITNKLISKERLRIVPHATLSIEAKQILDRNK
jgi:DnaK suppressor protein